MGKEITLAELASANNINKDNVKKVSDNIKTATPVTVNDLAKNLPGKDEEEEGSKAPVVVDNAFKAMADRLNASKKFINEVVVPTAEDNAREMVMEEELGKNESAVDTNKTSEEVSYQTPSTENITFDENDNKEDKKEEKNSIPTNNPTSDLDAEMTDLNDMIEDLNDIAGDDEFTVNDSDTEETVEETRERFKETLKDIKVTKNNIDLSEFTIKKQPVSSSVILNSINSNKVSKEADWVLYSSKRSIRMRECEGPELDALRKTIDNSNDMNGIITSLKFAYDHIVDANKPSFEVWTKTTRTEDLESVFFALYKACYGDVNLVGRTCLDPKQNKKHTGCGKTSIINTPIMDMVKYDNGEIKEKFNLLFQQDTTSSEAKIESHMVVASDNIAISYSDPTLYSTFIQFAALPENITSKYSDILNSLAYIDGFFAIDSVNKTLQPINIKVYPNNINKTILSKLKVYLNVLKTLTTDQYNVLTARLNNLIQDPKITYIYPKAICPECGAEIPEEEIPSVLSLLFTRAQLAQVKSL